MPASPASHLRRHGIARTAIAAAMLGAGGAARASLLTGDALDAMASYVALFVIVAVPIGLIVLFWLIHVLPEKIAEQRQHPQKEAIKVLCMLSLFFGGLLWPLAWLWAYSKPVLHKLAYGTDRHEDYYRELALKDSKAEHDLHADVSRLRAELEVLERRGPVPEELAAIRAQLAAFEQQLVAAERGTGAA